MSDEADYLIEHQMMQEQMKYDEDLARLIWTTKEGQRICVYNMTDEHMLNTAAFVKNHSNFSDWIEVFEDEVKRREL